MPENQPAPMGSDNGGKSDKPQRALTRVSKWLGSQSTNLDPERRAAAVHVMSRWDIHSPWFSMAKTLRTLTREESPYLRGFQGLCDDYVRVYDDDGAKLEIGSAGPFMPIEIERCYKCGRDSIPGANACARHGGQYLSAQDAARITAHATARIIEATDAAHSTLMYLLDEGKSEMVRMQTAFGILDRAGIGPNSTIKIDVTREGEDAAAMVASRLDAMKEAIEKAAEIEYQVRVTRETDDAPIDAEVVLDDQPQSAQ